MTEIEKMQRAKMYIDKLANGINPLTDEEMTGNETLNQVRISRCLFYVADILGKVIENGGEIGSRVRVYQASFTITEEQAAKIEITDAPVGIAVFTARINAVIDPSVKKITAVAITTWLLKNGYLEEVIYSDKRSKIASEKGTTIGIYTKEEMGAQGYMYRKNFYNSSAQKFIADHIIRISQEIGEKMSEPKGE